jgi:hypothetical protein
MSLPPAQGIFLARRPGGGVERDAATDTENRDEIRGQTGDKRGTNGGQTGDATARNASHGPAEEIPICDKRTRKHVFLGHCGYSRKHPSSGGGTSRIVLKPCKIQGRQDEGVKYDTQYDTQTHLRCQRAALQTRTTENVRGGIGLVIWYRTHRRCGHNQPC